MIIDEIIVNIHEIEEKRRKLNMLCSKLNGTAAVIPPGAPDPLGYFPGRKVLLHNVRYDYNNYCIRASIKVPYLDAQGWAVKIGGDVLEFTIGPRWFQCE